MAEKKLKHRKQKITPKADTKTSESPVVLVGTYRGKQLEEWPEYYNYPIFKGEKFDEDACKRVSELWLFSGTKDQRSFTVEYVGVKTRAELVKDYGYKARGKGHGDGSYVLFRRIAELYEHTKGFAECVIIRTKDFSGQGKNGSTVQKQLKAYLQSPERKDPFCAKLLPEIITKLPPKLLRVSDSGVQMNFFEALGVEPTEIVPFPNPENPRFTFIDLFAGIGGFRLAMRDCGGACVFSSEFDPYAQETYKANFGETPAGDITKQETHDLIPANFDIVCAGFPCQAFSLAGKRQGFKDNFKGLSRGTLFQEVVKICVDHRPRAVFCENVKGLYIHDHGNTFRVIKGAFEEIGYKFFWKILNSKDFGVPQCRERIYMVAFRNDCAPENFEFPEPTGGKVCLAQIRQGSQPGDPPVTGRYYLSDVYVETLRRHRRRHEAAGHGFGYVIRKWDGVSGAIVCGGMGRETNLVQEGDGVTPTGIVPETHIKGEINREGIRKMTPLEWSRLQGFPAGYRLTLSDVHLYKQFGNSVSVPVIHAIAERIVQQLDANPGR